MTDQQVNDAIAEFCGWRKRGDYWRHEDYPERWHPCYTIDLGELAHAEQRMNTEQLAAYIGNFDFSMRIYLGSPPEVRANAFVKAIGKWVD